MTMFYVFQIVDLLVVLLRLGVQGEREECHMLDTFRICYDVLLTYMTGHSIKNSLYLAKYISFFQSQITVSHVMTWAYHHNVTYIARIVIVILQDVIGLYVILQGVIGLYVI